MRSLREIELALLNGDSVTVPELREAHMHFENLNKSLFLLGPHWDFALKEAHRLSTMCNDYLRARERSD